MKVNLDIKSWMARARLWLKSLVPRAKARAKAAALAIYRWTVNALVTVGNWRIKQVLFYTVCVAFALYICINISVILAVKYLAFQIPHNPPVTDIVYLDQGWGPDMHSPARQRYYYTPQGTSLVNMRYRWFVYLEQTGSRDRFADPHHMRALGFIVDKDRSEMNPYQLPVGFTSHFDPEFKEEFLDFTCAACHTGELHVVQPDGKQVAIRIDGGQAMHAFTSARPGHFGPGLMAAMTSTYLNPWKWERFSRNVLQEAHASGNGHLRQEFGKMLLATLMKAFSDTVKGKYPIDEGFGRTDAIARISNQVFGDELDPANYVKGDAPASYPAIWDTFRFDWVQYAGSVSQPLARNMGEALGVGARINLVDAYGRPVPVERRFNSQVHVENLVKIENTLHELKPPLWPEQILGKLDQAKVAKGKDLYKEHCAHCHEPCLASARYTAVYMPLRPANDPVWRINLIPIEEVGTDPRAALNFYNYRVNLLKTGLTAEELRPLIEAELRTLQQRDAKWASDHHLPAPKSAEDDIKRQVDAIGFRSVSIGAALNYVGLLMKKVYYEDHPNVDQQVTNGYGAVDVPQVLKVYKARPLGGVWATAPYLHNGSVPNLYEMLVPAAQRSKHFFISRMNFDPVLVGLVKQPLVARGFWFDTSIPGNLNVGHEFRAGYGGHGDHATPSPGVVGPELSDPERWALVEYLKTPMETPAACKADR